MKYTKYFGLITKGQGLINLNANQFQRMMNIIHIKGVLLGFNKIKDTLKDSKEFYKYDILIFKQHQTLSNLTGNLNPDILLKEMINLSI